MENVPDNQSCTASQTLTESARVRSPCENLDPDAAKTAFEEKVLHGLADQVVHNVTASDDETADVTPDSDDLPLPRSILPAIDQKKRITRKSGDSVAISMQEKRFSQARLDQLCDRWDNGAEVFWASYQERCEIVYEIQKETAKPGSNGEFSAALRRIGLANSTAYDMIKRHRIRLGEIPDLDAPDSRDVVEENSHATTGAGPEERDDLPEPNPRPLRLDPRKQATLVQAQLAINNLVAALKNGGDWQSALAEYEKVAVAPAMLDSFANTLRLEPDWKSLLVQFMDVLEQHGDRLPLPVLIGKRAIETMLGSGAYKNSVSSLGIEAPPKYPPRSVGPECTGCEVMHRGIASRAEAHPEWTDQQLAEACGCSPIIVRQTKTRFLAWRQEGAA